MHGEVIGLRQDRSADTATALLNEDLTPRQRAAITAVCTDMHRPYLNPMGAVLPSAEVVSDKFHVLQQRQRGARRTATPGAEPTTRRLAGKFLGCHKRNTPAAPDLYAGCARLLTPAVRVSRDDPTR